MLEFPVLASLTRFVVFRLYQLLFVSSRDEWQWFTSQRGVVFCLLWSAADRHPSALLLSVNISHAVMNVWWLESWIRLSALTCCVFPLSISPVLFLTTIYSHLSETNLGSALWIQTSVTLKIICLINPLESVCSLVNTLNMYYSQ